MKQSARIPLTAGLVLAVAACGGGGGGGSSDGSTTPAATSGVITAFGSIVVNGTHLALTNATIEQDDDTVAESELELGQTVCVKDDGSGRHVEVEEVLRGPVDAVSANTVTAMGQTVETDPAATVFDDTPASDPASLAQDDIIEVGGLRRAGGVIEATLVEKKSFNDNDYTVTGRVRNHQAGAGTFAIDGLTVDYTSFPADTDDMPAGSWDGLLVEVEDSTHSMYTRGPATLVATKVEPENPACGEVGERVEIERIVTAVDPGGDGVFAAGETFEVGGDLLVDSTGAEYRLGTPADILVGARVEVEGRILDDGTLQAEEIKFDDNDARLSGIANNVDAGAGTLEVLGVTISLAASGAEFDGDGTPLTGLSDLTSGVDFVEVEGRVGPTGNVIAYEIERRDDDSRDRELRGPVSARNANAGTLTLLGVGITAGPGTEYESDDDQALTRAQFFARLVLDATIVEATWDGDTFVDTTAAPEELEIEEEDEHSED